VMADLRRLGGGRGSCDSPQRWGVRTKTAAVEGTMGSGGAKARGASPASPWRGEEGDDIGYCRDEEVEPESPKGSGYRRTLSG
jgi:hypothetical protein